MKKVLLFLLVLATLLTLTACNKFKQSVSDEKDEPSAVESTQQDNQQPEEQTPALVWETMSGVWMSLDKTAKPFVTIEVKNEIMTIHFESYLELFATAEPGFGFTERIATSAITDNRVEINYTDEMFGNQGTVTMCFGQDSIEMTVNDSSSTSANGSYVLQKQEAIVGRYTSYHGYVDVMPNNDGTYSIKTKPNYNTGREFFVCSTATGDGSTIKGQLSEAFVNEVFLAVTLSVSTDGATLTMTVDGTNNDLFPKGTVYTFTEQSL